MFKRKNSLNIYSKISNQNVLNLARGGNGPLLNLAILYEFSKLSKNYGPPQLGRYKFIFRFDLGIRKRRARIRLEKYG